MKSSLNKMLRFMNHYPLILLFLVSSYLLYLSYEQLDATRKVERAFDNTTLLANVAKALSKERELSTVFLLNNQDSASKETLQAHYVHANETIKAFHDFYQMHPLSPNVQAVVAYLTKLAEMRNVVENNTIDFTKMYFDYYTKINRFLYQEMATLTRFASVLDSVENLDQTHFMLLEHQEYLTQERDFVARILTRYLPFESKDVALWMKMFTTAEPFDLSMIHNKQLRYQLETLQQAPETIEMEHKITQAKADIVTASQNGDYMIEPYTWVKLLNQKIELLDNYTQRIYDARHTTWLQHYHQALAQLISAAATCFIAILLLFAGFIPSNTFPEEKDEKQNDETNEEESFEEEQDETPNTHQSLLYTNDVVVHPLKNDHMVIEEPNEKWEILICKKSTIETKLFSSILSKQYTSIDTVITYNELRRKVMMNHYSMVLFDLEVLEEEATSFLELIHDVEAAHHLGHIHTIMFVNPSENDPLFQPAFDTVLTNSISKVDLEALVSTYMKRSVTSH